MKQEKMFFKNGLYAVVLTVLLMLAGCGLDLEGLTCETNADCASGTCSSQGVCVGAPVSTDDGNGANDTESGTENSGANNQGTDNPGPGAGIPFTAVDLLFVVDNSNSMIEEQQILADAMGTLTEQLSQGVGGVPLDVRLAITTTDMGVSFAGGVYENANDCFYTAHCVDEGDNGEFIYDSYGCDQTPIAAHVVAPGYISPVNAETGHVNWNEFVTASACLIANIGTDGCNYEQQLAAVTAAMSGANSTAFLRADAMTAIVVISDESDCSIANPEWFEVSELGTFDANLACGKHPDFLQDVTTLKNEIIAAKTAATGVNAQASVMFTAIAGVPVGSVCEGRGDELAGCMDVQPGVNGTGTMANPDAIERPAVNGTIQRYYEYACIRYAPDAQANELPLTAAYPGTRFVQLAQQFGEMGTIYSICNEDWKPAMLQMATSILQKLSPSGN